MAPPSRPTPAPTPAAPLLPPMAAPAAAPTIVPTAALVTPLSAPAWLGLLPPSCALANCRQSLSSKRNWSKLLPVPGSDIWLGPFGTVTQPASTASSSTAPVNRQDPGLIFIPHPSLLGLGRHALPAPRALLDVRV